MHKILFNSWSGAFFNPGGGEVQLSETRKHLLRKGVEVDLYDQWTPQREFDIFHQFSLAPGVNYPVGEYRTLGKRIALSTILWAEFPVGHPERERIREILNLADILFTNSNAESVKLARAFDIQVSKFHKTRNGISDEYLNSETNADFRGQHKITRDFILSVANIDRRKNTKMLIQACRELDKSLVLVGEIRDPVYFREIQTECKGNYVHVGAIREIPLLKSAFQQAALFALPSYCETPGIAALEAGSQGCKIAITAEGCAEEYFGSYATYINPFEATLIVEGLDRELKTSRNKTEIAGHIRKNFSWSQTADDVIEGYDKLLSLGEA